MRAGTVRGAPRQPTASATRSEATVKRAFVLTGLFIASSARAEEGATSFETSAPPTFVAQRACAIAGHATLDDANVAIEVVFEGTPCMGRAHEEGAIRVNVSTKPGEKVVVSLATDDPREGASDVVRELANKLEQDCARYVPPASWAPSTLALPPESSKRPKKKIDWALGGPGIAFLATGGAAMAAGVVTLVFIAPFAAIGNALGGRQNDAPLIAGGVLLGTGLVVGGIGLAMFLASRHSASTAMVRPVFVF